MRTVAFIFFIALISADVVIARTLVGGTDFTLTQSVIGGTLIAGDSSNTANGLTANTPHGTPGGGLSYSFSSPFEFSYEFQRPANLSGNFFLYNGWDVLGQAINQFSLSFFDANGLQVGAPLVANGAFGVHDEVFPLPATYAGVKTSVLRVESAHDGFIEFREVGFEGELQSSSPTLEIFSTSFDSDIPAQFSGAGISEPVQAFDGLGSAGNKFAGNFLRNSASGAQATATTLTLTQLPKHTSVDIDFLLAILESWDGGGNVGGAAPDIFQVWVDGANVFSESFDTAGVSPQSYVPPPNVELATKVQLGSWGHSYPESAYDMGSDPVFDSIAHSADTLTIQWFATGAGWQAGGDESWALDNVSVTLRGTASEFLWTGDDGDSSFNNSANWLPVAVPGSDDTATINGPATINGEGQPSLLNVNGSLFTSGLTLTSSSVVNGGSIVATGSNAFLRFVNSSVNNANGAIQATGAGAAIQIQPGTNVVGGTLNSADGATIEVNGGNVSAALIQTTSGGSIDLNSGLLRATALTTNAIGVGDFSHTGGRLEVLNFDGNFQQDGGTFAPGLPIGVSTLTGAYILQTGATLEIELGGNNIGEFDQLLVGGVALQGGQLSVVLRNGFQAAAGDSFGIVSVAGARTGTFSGLPEGALVGDFGEDLFITYKAGDGNDIGLYNPLVLGSINFADAGPDDDAFVVGDRAGSGGIPAPPVTITLESLTLLNGSSFTLDPNEILELNGGTLFIGQGAVFSGNGVIRGNVINAGLLRIPIVRVPTMPQVTGGYVEIEIPESTFPEFIIDLSGGGGGFAVGFDTLISFEFEDEPTPIVIQGDPAPNEGTIRFDASLEITGSYEQRDTGALRLFIAGDDLPGENYSQLIVGEEVTLAGSIEIVFDPTLFGVFGYVPMVGDTFDLIVSDGGITIADTGLNLLNFVTADGASLVGGVTLSPYESGIAADPDRLLKIGETLFKLTLEENATILRAEIIAQIEFVPEPASYVLLTVAAAFAVRLRRA